MSRTLTFASIIMVASLVFVWDFFWSLGEGPTRTEREPGDTALPDAVFDPLQTETEESVFQPFGKTTVSADMMLRGRGTNIDSPEFFESDRPEETRLYVSAKGNDLIEVWRFPFEGQEQEPLHVPALPNGLAIDQELDLLFVGNSETREAEAFSLPQLESVKKIGSDKLESGETNVDVLKTPDGRHTLFVTETRRVKGFDLESGRETISFAPNVESVEEVLADDFHQLLYIPEENGVASRVHSGGGIVAYRPNGVKHLKNGSNVIGRGVFDGDGEGITLYACRTQDGADTGRGFIVAADQAPIANNGFEIFDRSSWRHLGTLTIEGVFGTDGIASTERPLPGYPDGLFAASHNDEAVALVSWQKIFEATRLSCDAPQTKNMKGRAAEILSRFAL